MTYRDLWHKASILLDNGKITLGEYEKMTRPLDREIEQETIIDKIRAEIVEMRSKQNCSCSDCLDIIDKYRSN